MLRKKEIVEIHCHGVEITMKTEVLEVVEHIIIKCVYNIFFFSRRRRVVIGISYIFSFQENEIKKRSP